MAKESVRIPGSKRKTDGAQGPKNPSKSICLTKIEKKGVFDQLRLVKCAR
jgi:hypothetical protein